MAAVEETDSERTVESEGPVSRRHLVQRRNLVVANLHVPGFTSSCKDLIELQTHNGSLINGIVGDFTERPTLAAALYAWAWLPSNGNTLVIRAIPPTERQQTSLEPDSSWPSEAEGSGLLAMAACRTYGVRRHFHIRTSSQDGSSNCTRLYCTADYSPKTMTTAWQSSSTVWEIQRDCTCRKFISDMVSSCFASGSARAAKTCGRQRQSADLLVGALVGTVCMVSHGGNETQLPRDDFLAQHAEHTSLDCKVLMPIIIQM